MLTEVDVGRAQGVVGDVDDGAGDVFRVRAARFVDGLDQVAAANHARSLIMSITRESDGLACSIYRCIEGVWPWDLRGLEGEDDRLALGGHLHHATTRQPSERSRSLLGGDEDRAQGGVVTPRRHSRSRDQRCLRQEQPCQHVQHVCQERAADVACVAGGEVCDTGGPKEALALNQQTHHRSSI